MAIKLIGDFIKIEEDSRGGSSDRFAKSRFRFKANQGNTVLYLYKDNDLLYEVSTDEQAVSFGYTDVADMYSSLKDLLDS
jgi:hypothetical protein